MSAIPPTTAEFLALYPAFAELPDAQIAAALALSTALLAEDVWGDFYGDAVGLDAAHNLVMDVLSATIPGAQKAASGVVSSVSGPGHSVSFNSVAASFDNKVESWYSKTSYGQKFLRLQSVVITPGTLCA